MFVVSAHEYELKVGSVEFKPSIDGEKHLLPERVHDASVMIAKDYEVYGTASGSVTLLVPVYVQLWLRPESTVFQSPIDFGTLTFDITVVDLRTNYSATQRNQTDVVWFNGLT